MLSRTQTKCHDDREDETTERHEWDLPTHRRICRWARRGDYRCRTRGSKGVFVLDRLLFREGLVRGRRDRSGLGPRAAAGEGIERDGYHH